MVGNKKHFLMFFHCFKFIRQRTRIKKSKQRKNLKNIVTSKPLWLYNK